MALEFQYTATAKFNKNGATFSADQVAPGGGSSDVLGDNAIKTTHTVGPTDSTLDKAAIGDIGFFLLKNLGLAEVPAEPVVTVTTAGTPGSTTRKYKVVANFADGSKSVSAEFTLATTNATLDGTNYDVVAWTDVGAATYDIYRTVSGGTPSTVGKIHSGSTTSPYNDQGAAGDASSVPAEIASNKPVLIGPDGSIYPDLLYAGETQLRRANPADMTDIHVKSLGGFTELEQLLVEA